MKKESLITILLTVLMSMTEANVFASDVIFFGAKNDDGVTIYYNLINDETELEVRRSLDYSGNIVIPEEVTYKDKTLKVTNIESHAFWQCSGLTSVVILNSVTTIGDNAFWECKGLTSVTIGNSVTSIGVSAFSQCRALTSVIIPNSVTFLGPGAFFECSNLNSVTLGNSLMIIGECAFGYCGNLTSIKIPNSVTTIRLGAFSFTGLTSVVIPDGVSIIGAGALGGCSSMTSITIPNSVTTIEVQAFALSDNLTSVISMIENPFEIGGREPDSSGLSTFSVGVYDNATLYVPVGTLEKYKATEGWKDFKNIEEFDPSGIKQVANDNVNSSIVFDLNGKRLSNLQKGINIIRQSDGTTKKVIVR